MTKMERFLWNFIILVVWIGSVFALPPFVKPLEKCVSKCSVNLATTENSTVKSADCNFIQDTLECEKRTSGVLNESRGLDSTSETCRLDQVRVNLSPYIFDHENYHPALSLRINLTVWDQSTRAVAFRLECLNSGSETEFYCENQTRPANWPRFYWPCRLFDFSNVQTPESIALPLEFHNDCFRLTSFSLFKMNVTLYPQNCVASYIFRMPSQMNVMAKNIKDHMPLVSINADDAAGIYINFSSAPPEMRVRRTAVELYELIPNEFDDAGRNKRVLVRRETVPSHEDGTFFKDLTKGKYMAIVYAQHSLCDEEKCLSMQVPFNLSRDYYSIYAQEQLDQRKRLEKAWIPVTAAVVGVVAAFLVLAFVVVMYLRWKAAQRKRRQGTIAYLQFTRRPVVLILYTNDFGQHRRSVLELAHYLQNRANCEVELDEWVFTSTTNGYRTPAEWLMHALQRADYFLIVFSSGAKETVFRPVNAGSFVELRSERPWDETFAPAVNFVLQRILQTARNVDASVISRDTTVRGKGRSTSAFDRYVCLWFSYSSVTVVPDLFRTLPCPKFQLPDDLRQLICHVHEIADNTVYEDSPLDADRLCNSIAEASRFIESNPDWMQSRLVERGENERKSSKLGERNRITEISAAIDRLRAPVVDQVPENLEEFYTNILEGQNRSSQANGQNDDTYLLIPPSSSTEEEGAPDTTDQFDLVPPDDDELASLFFSNTVSNRSQSHD